MGSTAAEQTGAAEKRREALGPTVTATAPEHETADEDLETDDAATAPTGPQKIQSLQQDDPRGTPAVAPLPQMVQQPAAGKKTKTAKTLAEYAAGEAETISQKTAAPPAVDATQIPQHEPGPTPTIQTKDAETA